MPRFLTTVALLLTLLAGSFASVAAQDATPGATPAPAAPGLGAAVPIFGADGQEEGQIVVNELFSPFEGYDPNSPPQRGFRFVLLDVTVTAGVRDIDVSPSAFSLVDAEGFVVSQTFVSRPPEMTEATPDFAGGPIAAGQEMSGPIFFQMLNGTEPALVLYRPDFDRVATVADLRDGTVAQGEPVPYLGVDGAPAATITVEDVAYPFEGYDPSSPPERGFALVGAVITVENTGAQPFVVDPGTFAVVDADGFAAYTTGVFRPEESTAQVPDLGYNGELPPGETASGLVTFQVLAGSEIAFIQYTPQGDRYLRVAEYPDGGAIIESSGVLDAPAAGTPEAVGSPASGDAAALDLGEVDCDALTAWGEATTGNVNTLTEVFVPIAGGIAANAADADAIRDAAAAMAEASAAQAALDVPEVAVPLNDALAGAFAQAETTLTTMADFAESGDEAGLQSAFAEFQGIFDTLETPELAALGDALAAACPGFSDL